MKPLYIRTYCVFCKKIIYSDRRKLHGLCDSDSFQRAKDIFKEDIRKHKLKESKIKSHFENCKSFQRAVKSNIVPSGATIISSKAFVPSAFKDDATW